MMSHSCAGCRVGATWGTWSVCMYWGVLILCVGRGRSGGFLEEAGVQLRPGGCIVLEQREVSSRRRSQQA